MKSLTDLFRHRDNLNKEIDNPFTPPFLREQDEEELEKVNRDIERYAREHIVA